ncbi:unnamed protein product [Owenia fusiformis]|uniref:Uncharacterized protein n=1 Tax=Owenia fusiformis TaxID=6347 RepID=A0A8J1XFE0_OWEFU|nr:unnamed protein product [Owenia fusiformis]
MTNMCQRCKKCMSVLYNSGQFLRHLMKSTFVRIWFFIYLLTFGLVLPVILRDFRFSIYYRNNDSEKYGQMILRKTNEERKEKANEFIQRYNKTFHNNIEKHKLEVTHGIDTKDGKMLDFVVTIVTVSRNKHTFDSYEPKYLSQTVWKFLEMPNPNSSSMKNFRLCICNVDDDPEKYKEAQLLRSIVTTFQRFNKSEPNKEHILEKEKQDYVYCLNSSLQLNPKYVLLVEDDALPKEDLFPVLEHVIAHRDLAHYETLTHASTDDIASNVLNLGTKSEMSTENNSTDAAPYAHDKVLYYKLYHPERLLGFISFEPERLPELLGISVLLGYLVFMILFPCSRYLQHNRTKSLVLISLYWCLVVLAIGRPHLVTLRSISKYLYSVVPAPSCCTPAMLYPSGSAREIIEYLSKVKCKKDYAKDMALEDFRKATFHRSLMVQPNLFSHIGLYSSLRDAILPPHLIYDT